MAQQVNQVVIGGNLVRDPELRHTRGGSAVCSLRLANNRRAKVGDEWQDRAGYFDVSVWGAQGENCAEYLAKGRGVLVVGELRWREWEDRDGNKRQAVEINAREVQFLGGGRDGERRSATDPEPESEPDRSDLPPASGPEPPAAADDDIPF